MQKGITVMFVHIEKKQRERRPCEFKWHYFLQCDWNSAPFSIVIEWRAGARASKTLVVHKSARTLSRAAQCALNKQHIACTLPAFPLRPSGDSNMRGERKKEKKKEEVIWCPCPARASEKRPALFGFGGQ
jgi:hypothetical protein